MRGKKLKTACTHIALHFCVCLHLILMAVLQINIKLHNASLIYGASLRTSVENDFHPGIGNIYKKSLSILKECLKLSMM
jgi:hypothetical protein